MKKWTTAFLAACLIAGCGDDPGSASAPSTTEPAAVAAQLRSPHGPAIIDYQVIGSPIVGKPVAIDLQIEAADASLELLMRGAAGWEQPFFRLESFSVDTDHRSGTNARLWNDVAVDVETSATVKVWVDDTRHLAVGEGNGPVNALDAALRNALGDIYPALDRISLTDFKVRVLDTGKGTGAITRVLLDSTDGSREWTTIGVSENIIEASWQALVDSLVYGLLHSDG